MSVEDTESKLLFYLEEMTKAKKALSLKSTQDITSAEIQSALCERLEIDDEDATRLLDFELSANQIFNLLESYNFFRPEVLQKISFQESIVPNELPELLEEQYVKVKGEKWVIHKTDKDDFPSVPHAHNYQKNISVHLGTGEFFRKRNSMGFLKCKKLVKLRDKITGHQLPTLSDKCKKAD